MKTVKIRSQSIKKIHTCDRKMAMLYYPQLQHFVQIDAQRSKGENVLLINYTSEAVSQHECHIYKLYTRLQVS